MTGPLDSQYLVLDEMVARYGDEEIRGVMLDDMALPAGLAACLLTAAEALDVLTLPEADRMLDRLAREFPVDVDESDNDAVADEQRVER